MDFIKKEIDPMTIKVAGNEYPAIFNYTAIIGAESDYGEIPATVIGFGLNNFYDKDGYVKTYTVEGKDGQESEEQPMASLPPIYILTILSNMMKAAGVEVTTKDLMDVITPKDMPALVVQMREIINCQAAKTEEDNQEKNAKTAAKTKN